MCTSHQPGSVTRFHMAIVAIMVLLLVVTAVITGTCSISSEGNRLRHTAPPPPHTISQSAAPHSMADCMPGCPMHRSPCPPASRSHHGSAVCTVCAAPLPPATTASQAPSLITTLATVTFPGVTSALPPRLAAAVPDPPPLDHPRSARPASLRV